jgi:hypothetical protein
MCDRSDAGTPRPVRRGVALMLVVVAMGTATVMTTAYLLSKDNSAAIGANAQDTAASAWAARSGAGVALAILQTEADWMDAEPEKLLEGFAIAGGTVSVVLTDLNGSPPDGTETELAMTVVSDVNGVKTVLQRIVAMNPEVDLEDAVDPEMGEFGVFASGDIDVREDSKVAIWPMSPAFKSGSAVNLGAGFTSSASLKLDGTASLGGTRLFVRPDASVGLKSMLSDVAFSGGMELPVVVPAVEPRLPSAFVDGLPVKAIYDIWVTKSSDSVTLSSGKRDDLNVIGDKSVVTLDDSTGGLYEFRQISLSNMAVLRIKGDVSVYIPDDLWIGNKATVELADADSRVRFYVGDTVGINDAGMGVASGVAHKSDRGMDDIEAYSSPERFKVYMLSAADGGVATPQVRIDDHAIALATVHAPTACIRVSNESTMIGRLTGASIEITSESILLYDATMDHKTGFTASNSPYYKSNGEPIDGLVEALASFDTSLGLDGFTSHVMAHSVVPIVSIPVPIPGAPTPRSEERAVEKPWPFVAMAIEEGQWVPGDNEGRQDGLYVPLDPDIFDLDLFYNEGLIVATHAEDGNVVEDIVEDLLEGLGGLGLGGLFE